MGIWGGSITPQDVRRATSNAALGTTLDGQGDILLYDDFSDGLEPYTNSAIGVGSSIDLSLLRRLSGTLSLRHVTGTGTTIGANSIRPLEFLQLGSAVGIETAFMVDANTGIVDVFISLGDGTTEYDFIIRVNAGTGQLQYQDATPAFVNIQAYTPSATAGLFHRIKAVFDPNNAAYDRIIIDTNQIATIKGVACRTFPNAVAPYLQAALRSGPAAGVSSTVYFDRLVVTANEVL